MHEEDEALSRNEMNDAASDQRLEAALRVALRAEQPSDGFADRLEARLAYVKQQGPGVAGFSKALPATRMTGRGFDRSAIRGQLARAAVLLLAVTLPLGWRLHHQSEMARGEAVKEQVLLALRITGSQLRSIEERTQSINAGMPEGDSR